MAYNVLICDDEKDIVSALKIYLSSENYNTFEAYTGEESLKIIENNDIHLVLMDIMMPEMDGLTAMVKLHAKSTIFLLYCSLPKVKIRIKYLVLTSAPMIISQNLLILLKYLQGLNPSSGGTCSLEAVM